MFETGDVIVGSVQIDGQCRYKSSATATVQLRLARVIGMFRRIWQNVGDGRCKGPRTKQKAGFAAGGKMWHAHDVQSMRTVTLYLHAISSLHMHGGE